ncbi:DoxX family protein [Taibaiella soli]|uniref:DoxX family protein n=1 Tax=Taibaiella soli TaxID=1649169 RepID=A0A2W2B6X7_9BACT|nr:DoxX family protein [Taibaiella soli]PZF71757.1 DoxX family protein [Taibaiella soli]
MNTALWIIQSLLALAFVMPGYGKLFSTRAQHIADGHIKPDASLLPIRILGVLEWLGCIGIIVPWFTGIAPVLTPIAATGFALIMAAGLVNHIMKKEYKMIPLLGTILALAVIVAYFRFRQLG